MLQASLSQLPPTAYERLHFVASLLYQRARAVGNAPVMVPLQHALYTACLCVLTVVLVCLQEMAEAQLSTLDILMSFKPEDALLPFHALVSQPWAVLPPVLTGENIGKLIALSAPLSLNPDHFYVHLVRRLVVGYPLHC